MPDLNIVLEAISCYNFACVVSVLPRDRLYLSKLVGSKRSTNLGTKCCFLLNQVELLVLLIEGYKMLLSIELSKIVGTFD